MNYLGMSDSAILEILGDRVKRERLNQNRTQIDLSKNSGVGLGILKRLEDGKGCTLNNFIRLLRALGKLDHLDSFLPEPGISPIELARLSGRQRKEASGKRGRPLKSME
jgi:transcriptional regulator with XRE-family HTH domain